MEINKIVVWASALSAAAFLYFAIIRRRLAIIDIRKDLMRSGNWPSRPAPPTDITVHHAASANTATPYDFARWHVTEKGWPGIGYHYVIDRTGLIYLTNAPMVYSYHNGYNNKEAIGICLVGNMEKGPMTDQQLKSLINLIDRLKRQYPIKYLNGHKEYEQETACPGRFTNMGWIRNKTGIPARVTGKTQFRPISATFEPNKADN